MKNLFRWKAVVPGLVIGGTVLVFCAFFMDWAIEWGVERAGTALNGARVDLAGVDVSWRDGSVTLRGLEVTDKAAPMTNAVSVEKMNFRMAVKPLFWAKVIIENGEITGIRTGTPRKSSGAVAVKEEAPKEGEKKPEEAAPAPAAPALPSGGSTGKFNADDVKAEDLESYRTAVAEKDRVESVASGWDKVADSVDVDGKTAEVKAFIDRVKGTSYSGAEGMKKAAEDLKEAQKLQRELKDLQDRVAAAKKSVTDETGSLKGTLSRIGDLKKKDIDAILAKLGIGGLSTDAIVKAVIGEKWFARIDSGLYWFRRIRAMMPPKGKKPPPPPAREGRDIAFKFRYKWPVFHLKKASLDGVTSGDSPIEYSGTLTDVTSDPKLVGKPAVLSVKGSGKGQSMSLKVVLDYTGETGRETVAYRYSGFDLAGTAMGDAGGPVRIESGTGTLVADIVVRGEALSGMIGFDAKPVRIGHELSDSAKSNKIMGAVHKTLVGLNRLQVSITLGGRLTSPSFGVKSSMDKALKTAISSMMKGEAAAARRKVEARVGKLVDGERNKLASVVTGKSGKALGKLGVKASSVNSAQGQVDRVIEDLKKKSTGQAAGAATGAAGGVLKKKKLGF